jgi:thioesterase domain-containing protein
MSDAPSGLSRSSAWVRSGGRKYGAAIPPLLVPFRTTGSCVPFFLVHGARGWLFVDEEDDLPGGSDQPVYGFQAAGLDRRRMRGNTIGEMARQYVSAMKQVQREGPYFIGSACIGFVVAIEMANQLRAAGQLVGPLLLLDPPPADQIKALELPWWGRYRHLARLYRQKLSGWTAWHERRRKQLETRWGHEIRRQDSESSGAGLRARVTASLDLKIALLKHTRWRYDGPVLILSSTKRLDRRLDGEGAFGGRLTGRVRRFEGGSSHGEVVKARTEFARRQLQQCIEIAQTEIARLSYEAAAPRSNLTDS